MICWRNICFSSIAIFTTCTRALRDFWNLTFLRWRKTSRVTLRIDKELIDSSRWRFLLLGDALTIRLTICTKTKFIWRHFTIRVFSYRVTNNKLFFEIVCNNLTDNCSWRYYTALSLSLSFSLSLADFTLSRKSIFLWIYQYMRNYRLKNHASQWTQLSTLHRRILFIHKMQFSVFMQLRVSLMECRLNKVMSIFIKNFLCITKIIFWYIFAKFIKIVLRSSGAIKIF